MSRDCRVLVVFVSRDCLEGCFLGARVENWYVCGVIAEYASVNVDINTFARSFILILGHYLLRYVVLRDILQCSFSNKFLNKSLDTSGKG